MTTTKKTYTKTYTVYHEDQGLGVYSGPGLTKAQALADERDCEKICGRAHIEEDRDPDADKAAFDAAYLDALAELGGVTTDSAAMARRRKRARRIARERLSVDLSAAM